MALSANTVWEVRTTGSDTNGGGFVTGASGTDYSQQDSAQYALTGVASSGSGSTFLTASASADMVGNLLQVVSGTNFTAGFYQVVSVSVGVSVTVDRSICTGVGASGVINIGGAFASIGGLGAAGPSGGMIAYIKYSATPFTLSSATPNAAGGPFLGNELSGLSAYLMLVGYDTTRTINNTDVNRPTILVPSSGVSSINVFDVSSYYYNLSISNIVVDGAGKSGIVGFNQTSPCNQWRITNCKAKDCVGGFAGGRGGIIEDCESLGHSSYGFYINNPSDACYSCEVHDGTGIGFFTNTGRWIRCLAYNNSGGAGFNVQAGYGGGEFVNCTAYNNGAAGFSIGNSLGLCFFENCLSIGNSGYGFSLANSLSFMKNCAADPNTSGTLNGLLSDHGSGFVTLSAGPFTNAAGGDFSLNNTAGGGAACRAAGFPGTFPGGLTTGYLDIGAVQHQDSGGGSGPAGRPVVIQNIGTY